MPFDLNKVLAGLEDPTMTEQAIDALSRIYPAPNADQVIQALAASQGGTAQGGAPQSQTAPVPSLPSQGGSAAPQQPLAPVFNPQPRPVPGSDPAVLAMLQRGLR